MLQSVVNRSRQPWLAALRTNAGARSGFCFALGALICLASWHEGAKPLLAALLPVFVVGCGTRREAWLLGFGYGLAIGTMGFGGAGAFFGGSHWLGVAAGAAYGLFFSLTVWALYPNDTSSAKKKAVAIAAWTILWAYPPVGAFLPGSLIATWGFWFPGLKWVGVALGLGGTVALGAGLHTKPGKMAFALALDAALLFSSMREADYSRWDNWSAVSTEWGVQSLDKVPETLASINAVIRREAEKGARVVVFPESILGTYSPEEDPVIELMIRQPAQRYGVNVILGATEVGERGVYNEARMYLPQSDRVVEMQQTARQTVPLASWNPLSRHHMPANWFAYGVNPVAGKKALWLFCYEEFLPWEVLYSIGREKPDVIVAMSNLWWTHGTGEPILQHRHAQGYARLFGIPLLSATNL